MDETNKKQEQWDIILQPTTGWSDLHIHDLWRYRDLVSLFVKRDFVTFYKQTALGPLWYIIQPLLTTVVFAVIFGRLAGIPMDGVPKFIFLLAGNVTWGYFAGCLNDTSTTFVKNAGVFGKVYFPRLTAPVSVVIIGLVKFGIQFVLFLGFYAYFIATDSAIRPTYFLLLLPVLLLQMAVLSLGAGILISAVTTKYRDLAFVMTFAIQLWMYVSSVIIPASAIPEKYLPIYMLNPMTSVIESFRYAFFGRGIVDAVYICISWAVTLVVLLLGIMLFNRVEKSFMDTV